MISTKRLLKIRIRLESHAILTSEHTVKDIEQKARKVVGMLKIGIKFTPTQPYVVKMIEKLLKNNGCREKWTMPSPNIALTDW